MVTKPLRTMRQFIMTLALVSATGCMCMGVGELMDRASQSRQAPHGMCGSGMMMHGTGNHAATTQATDADSDGADRARSSHELHGS